MATKSIWKFPLEITDHQTIEVPLGSAPLTVQLQYGQPAAWLVVDPSRESVKFDIECYGTGNPFHGAVEDYLGTVHMSGVWHFFGHFSRET